MDRWKSRARAALTTLALTGMLMPALSSTSRAESDMNKGRSVSDVNEDLEATVYGGQARHNTGARPWRYKPDFQLKDEVERRLAGSSPSDADDIEVSVRKGTVTLEGEVEDQSSLEAAIESAREAGAKKVISKLRMRHEDYATAYGSKERHNTGVQPWRKKSDSQLEEDVKRQLTASPLFDADDIEVSVKNGTALLTGVVENRRSLETAIDSAQEAGVKKVISKLKMRNEEYNTAYGGQERHNTGVRPWRKKSDSQLEEDVKSEMAESPFIDADDIEVSAKKGTVTLKGIVENRRSLHSAIDSARDAGAKNVISMLKMQEEE
jgi:osmotically-inducible protein OsmY